MSAKVAEIFETMEYGPAPESDKTAREWQQIGVHASSCLLGASHRVLNPHANAERRTEQPESFRRAPQLRWRYLCAQGPCPGPWSMSRSVPAVKVRSAPVFLGLGR